MTSTPRPSFHKCALACGLLTQADLDEAQRQINALPPPAGLFADDQTSDSATADERRLAERLVAMARISRYQATQLLNGHSKLSLGPYHIIDSIGQGGMGQVFRAEHGVLRRTVAIKVLPRSKSTPESIASFMREIRAQAQLDHENLVRAIDAGHDGNVYFLVVEFVPGADLRRYVRDRGPLGMSEAATIISQAAAGLQHAHQRGLVHRDVKPGNLLVTPEGHTKVSDLGLAGWLNEADLDPRSNKVVGTADYLSPEQILSPKSVGPPSDIYSLGCALYYAVTGKVPYPGGDARTKARRHCEDTPLHPRVLNPSLSEKFVDVLASMMEKKIESRLQTAADVIARLRPWAGESVSSPLDAETARQIREGALDTGSGTGELLETKGYPIINLQAGVALVAQRAHEEIERSKLEQSSAVSAAKQLGASPHSLVAAIATRDTAAAPSATSDPQDESLDRTNEHAFETSIRSRISTLPRWCWLAAMLVLLVIGGVIAAVVIQLAGE